MKRILFILLAAVLVLSMFSCSSDDTQSTTRTQDTTKTTTQTNTLVETLTEYYGQYLKAEVNYDPSPDVSDSTLQTLIEGNNEFAFDLYKQLITKTDGNLFYSPYSISLALAMTYAGANGQTKEQMAEVLNFLLADEELHAAFNKLAIELNSHCAVREGSEMQGIQLNIANSTWGQENYEFLPAFLNVLAENYDAGMRLLDYENDPEGCRQIINDWVSEETNGKIKNLIPEGGITTLTRLVLTNAIYFKAAWLYPFEEEGTVNDTFYLADGSEIIVPMMQLTTTLNYKDGKNYRAVQLLYDTNNMSMVVIVPDEGDFESFESSLTADSIADIIDSLKQQKLNLSMPKFEFEYKAGLREILQNMGMTDAFSGNADFSGMTGEEALVIDDVLHKAFISVDEKGTEAAAATAVMMAGSAPDPSSPLDFSIDRPFIVLITDNINGSIIFMGRVMNPAE
jgi:serpin B